MISKENYQKALKKAIKEQIGWFYTASVVSTNQFLINNRPDVFLRAPGTTSVIQNFDPDSPDFGEFLPIADLEPADEKPAP